MTKRAPWFSAEATRSAEEYRPERDKARDQLDDERRQWRLHMRALIIAIVALTLGHLAVLAMLSGG